MKAISPWKIFRGAQRVQLMMRMAWAILGTGMLAVILLLILGGAAPQIILVSAIAIVCALLLFLAGSSSNGRNANGSAEPHLSAL